MNLRYINRDIIVGEGFGLELNKKSPKVIYGIRLGSGEYDDYYTFTSKCFEKEEDAQKYINKYNRILQIGKERFKEISSIDDEVLYEKMTPPPNYYELWMRYQKFSSFHLAAIHPLELY